MGVRMDRRIADQSETKSGVEFYKEQALAAFARAEHATSEEARAEFLEIAVHWLKLATEVANLQDKRVRTNDAESNAE
jgi:hypothetical protein